MFFATLVENDDDGQDRDKSNKSVNDQTNGEEPEENGGGYKRTSGAISKT